MTRDKKIQLLEQWKACHDETAAKFDALEACFDSPTGGLFDAAWRAFDAYTAVLSILLDDDFKNLDWFASECDFGRKPMEAGKSGDMRRIATFDDLLWLIEVCK